MTSTDRARAFVEKFRTMFGGSAELPLKGCKWEELEDDLRKRFSGRRCGRPATLGEMAVVLMSLREALVRAGLPVSDHYGQDILPEEAREALRRHLVESLGETVGGVVFELRSEHMELPLENGTAGPLPLLRSSNKTSS